MPKKQLSVRLDADVMERLDAYAEASGISRTEAVERAVSSLTEAAQEAAQEPQEDAGGPERAETHAGDLRAVCEVLRASNADLRAEVSRLWSQLAEKDRQIAAAQGIADHAQQLHAAEVTRALPAEGEETRTLRQRLAAMFGRRG